MVVVPHGAVDGARRSDVNGAAPLRLVVEDVPARAHSQAPPAIDEHVYLLGRPPMRSYVDLVTDLAVDGGDYEAGELADEWREARDRVKALEATESGIADGGTLQPLPPGIEDLHQALLEDPLFKRSFGMVRCEIAMVELDRLVVYQKHINKAFVRTLVGHQTQPPDPAGMFRLCLPFDHPQPPVRWMRSHGNTFVFHSPSNDLRFLGPVLIDPADVPGLPPQGNVVRYIALAVGFGTNFLNAIHAEGRFVLNNGSHRAYAMRSLGATHAPCIVQHVENRDELRAIASSDLRRNPDHYLRAPRPPMLRDYFDPRLHKVLPLMRRTRSVRIKYALDESDAPSMDT